MTASRRTRFDILTAPRAKRRQWVKNAWRAERHNHWASITLQEAWASWDPRDCGPMTWGRITEHNGIRCA